MCMMSSTIIQAQRDSRWARVPLGFPDSGQTIGQYGCLLTCFSMLVNSTPPVLNEQMKALNMFNVSSFNTWHINKVDPSYPKFIGQTSRYTTVPVPSSVVKRIVDHVRANKPMFLEVDMIPYPRNNREDMHWVLPVGVYGHNGAEQIVMHDPWHGDQTTVCPRYGSSLPAVVRAVFYEW